MEEADGVVVTRGEEVEVEQAVKVPKAGIVENKVDNEAHILRNQLIIRGSFFFYQ